jgi:hypothetical protein
MSQWTKIGGKMKTYSAKIEPKGKAQALHQHIAKKMAENNEMKPLDVLIKLLDTDSKATTESTNGILFSDLSFDNNEKLDNYGNKTEHQLVSEMFIEGDSFNLGMLKKCMVAMAKGDFSRRESGTQWANKVDKQLLIHEKVTAQMAKNDAISDDMWFERELINTKWISVNCNTSMLNGDEYMVEHQKEVDDHNLKTRTVKNKDLGKYFNRSARAEKKKHVPKPESKPEPTKPDTKPEFDDLDNDLDLGEEFLGADGEPL